MAESTEKPKVTRMRGEERRALMLKQTAEVFAQHGYAQASIGELARACGVTEPMLYKHFGSKQNLFLLVLRHTGDQFFQSFRDRVNERASRSLEDTLCSLVLDYRDVAIHLQGSALMLLGALIESQDPEVKDAMREHTNELFRLIHGLLVQAQQQKLIPQERDLDAATWGYMSFLFAIQMRAKFRMFDRFSEPMLAESSRLWWQALRLG
ncbi:TetR/AcrR family transcriptional regulator [Chloroflexia bacterium SDU3-3]|nr:TetR/AcrR family transcriptional regulator [Chloroflexia bacterium SDU3-3]